MYLLPEQKLCKADKNKEISFCQIDISKSVCVTTDGASSVTDKNAGFLNKSTKLVIQLNIFIASYLKRYYVQNLLNKKTLESDANIYQSCEPQSVQTLRKRQCAV